MFAIIEDLVNAHSIMVVDMDALKAFDRRSSLKIMQSYKKKLKNSNSQILEFFARVSEFLKLILYNPWPFIKNMPNTDKTVLFVDIYQKSGKRFIMDFLHHV